MNLGLSDELKVAFPDVISIKRPLVKNQPLPDPQWISGFTCGEGCFKCTIFKSNTNLGESVKLTFQLTQDNRDKQLMKSLGTYLGCGRYEARSKDKNTQVGDFVVTKLSDITEKIIPFFEKYPINGVKHLDYLDFCRVAELMQNQAHLTPEGLDYIRKIKIGMNKGREFSDLT